MATLTTPIYSLPYPDGTERVADGDNAIGALATAVEDLIAAQSYRVLGFAKVEVDQSGIGGTAVALTGLSVAVDVPAGHRIRVSFDARLIGSAAAMTGRIRIRQDSVDAYLAATYLHAASQTQSINGSLILTPTAGLHTYSLTGQMSAGSGTISLNASPGGPSYIMVEDLGELGAVTKPAPDEPPIVDAGLPDERPIVDAGLPA